MLLVRPNLGRLVLLAAVLVAAGLTGCDDGGQTTSGIVIDVQQSSPANVTGFTMRTDDGRVMIFRVGPTSTADGTFPAVHLRDHLATAQRVAVRYVETDEGPFVIRLADAP